MPEAETVLPSDIDQSAAQEQEVVGLAGFNIAPLLSAQERITTAGHDCGSYDGS
jgi:hypothetical protein